MRSDRDGGDLLALGVRDLLEAISSGAVGPQEAATASVARAAASQPSLNAFTELVQEDLPDPPDGPLRGVPLAVKDVFVDGGRTPTVGSNVGGHWLRGTATLLSRLRQAGALVVGYTNLHEWGVDCTSAVTATGPVHNPWDPSRISGGSSGGSAAAVAAGIVPGAIGSDTGGSIRIPAACCGLVGLKPSWGRIPLEGFVDPGSPIDHAGPMARSVGDVRVLFEVLAAAPVAPVEVNALRVGVPRSYLSGHFEAAVGDAVAGAVDVLSGVVRSVIGVEVGRPRDALRGVAGIFVPRTYARLAHDLEERPDSFQPSTRALLLAARAMDDRDRTEAEAIKQRIAADWERTFRDVDVLITPTLSRTPPTIAECERTTDGGTSLPTIGYLALNGPMNLAGVPALSLPCGDVGGWTVSITLSAARGREDVVLALGEAFERVLDRRYADRIAPPTQ